MSWQPMNNGATIGTRGSEDGIIVRDEEFWNEEHNAGMRVTLERGGRTAPWSVTCGIYGNFLHTAWASSEAEGKAKYTGIKEELTQIMELLQRGALKLEDRKAAFINMKHLRDAY